MNLAAGVDVFRSATDREQARGAAADLARHAVPPQTAEVVTAVRGLVEDAFPWLADAFGVLIYAIDHAGDDEVARALTGFDGLVRNSIVGLDRETRSMACLLLGRISPAPALDLELLRLLADSEEDELTWACAAEAALELGGTGATELLGDESPMIRHRIARSLLHPRPVADPDLRARAQKVLDEPLTPAILWPAEDI